jgi:hypothetical protein
VFGRKGKKGDLAKPKAEKKDRKKAKAEKVSRKTAAPRPVGPTRKQPTNIYTIMLLLAMIAMLAANVLMWLEYFHYGSGLPQG